MGRAKFPRASRASAAFVFATAWVVLSTGLHPPASLATFPGMNGRIVFVRDSDLYTMNSDGTDVQQLTETPNRIEANPAWSPDGSKIAFEKNSPPGHWNIVSINADGNGLTKLTGGGPKFAPAWSPSGTWIAFTAGEIYIKRLSTGRVRQVTHDMGALELDWSVPGTIAFIGTSATDDLQEVYTIRPRGTGLLQLTDNDVREYSPDISPDGTQVLYEGYSYGGTGWDIWSVPSSGGTPVNLSNSTDAGDNNAAWSPDGSMIVFHSTRLFHDDIYLMNGGGSGQVLIENGADNDSYPDWQPLTA